MDPDTFQRKEDTSRSKDLLSSIFIAVQGLSLCFMDVDVTHIKCWL